MKEGWKYVKLGEVCDPTKNIKWELEDNSHKYIDLSSVDRETSTISNTELVNKDNAPSRAKQIVKQGDIIFATTRPTLRRVAEIKENFHNEICSTGFCILRPKADLIETRYLFNLLKCDRFYNYIELLQTGASYPAVTDKIVKNYEIPLPPLSEQQRIVEELDSTFAKIDALKANAEKLVEEAKALFAASLREIMKPKEGWEEKKLGEVCAFVRGPFGGSLKKECFRASGYAVYEQQNAIYNKFTFRYFVDKEKYQSMMRFKVSPGDLIMSCSGTVGKVAIVPQNAKEGIINQALLKLTPNKELYPFFLKYMMQSSYFGEMIEKNQEGVAIKNIASVAVLKTLLLPLPPLSEQERIVSTLDTLSAQVRQLVANFKKVSEECDALKQAILRETFE